MPSEAKTTTSPGSRSTVVSSYCVSGIRPSGTPSRRMACTWPLRTSKGYGPPALERVRLREAATALAIGKKIVKVASQFARGNIPRGEVETGDFACAVREQTSLNFASHLEILLEAELRVACFLIEARVFERNGDIGAKGRKHAFVFQGERARFRAFQIKNSDQSIA